MDPTRTITPALEPVLRSLRRRIRRVLASRGLLMTLVTAMAGLLVIAAADVAFAPMPPVLRWLCPLAWLAAVAAVAIHGWWSPLRQPLELVRIARWLEIHHPELDERISTVLEVSARHHPGTSPYLLETLAREACQDLGEINPRLEVSTRRARQWLWPAAALAAVWTLLFVLWPDPTKRHVVRALVPTSQLGTAGQQLVVTPGDVELIEGDPLLIGVRSFIRNPKPIELILNLADGTTSTFGMEPRPDGAVYQISRSDRGFSYQVRRGRETSDVYQVKVWPRPHLDNPKVRLEFPAYTQWPAREQALGEGVTAIAGTRVELKSRLNTDIAGARLDIDNETAGATTLGRDAGGTTVTATWTMEHPGHGSARLLLTHRLGRDFDGCRFLIESRPDNPPEVQWRDVPKNELRVKRSELLETAYQITDDVGLAGLKLVVQPQSGELAMMPLDMPPRAADTQAPVWRGRLRQPVAEWLERWPNCKVFKLHIRATDGRPPDLGGPGVGTSETVIVHIDDGAPTLARQQIAGAQQEARQKIDEARQAIQQAQQKIDRNRPQLREEKPAEPARKELNEARNQLADAKQQLENLADRLKDTPLAAASPELRETAGTLEQARQQLEDAPLQDTPAARDTAAADARETAAQAERQLEQLRQEMQQAEARVEDFAHLKDLEQQQRELARQANQALAQQPQQPQQGQPQPRPAAEQPPAQAWQQQQNQVAEALRQDARQQPDAQAAALDQQAQHAQELANQAREQAANQQALQQAQPPAQQQPQQAQASQPQQAEQPPGDQGQPGQPQPAQAESSPSEKSDPSAPKQPSSASKGSSGSGGSSNKPGPGDQPSPSSPPPPNPAQAAAQAAALAEAIREMPQVNGATPPMQQAAQTAQQAAANAAQAARQAAQNQAPQAAASHGQAAQQWSQAAAQLDQAAQAFAAQAAQAAHQPPGPAQAPAPAQPMAQAFHHAAQAAAANHQSDAAGHAQAAADALAQAAAGAMAAMQNPSSQGQPSSPGQPGAPGPPMPSNQPGMASDDALRHPQPDPGVPPELAKLGVSAEDWEKIKNALKAEAGGASHVALPEDYRDLVRRYFDQIAKDRPR